MPNKLSQFWQELKRRNVVRVITVYAASAFVVLELVDILAPSLRLPEWTLNLVLILLCVGFVIAVILSWIYDVHPEGGMVKTEPAHKVKQENIPKPSSGWKIASYVSFVVIVGLIILNLLPRNNGSAEVETIDISIAILPFKNISPDAENQYLLDGIMEAVLNYLTQIENVRVIASTSVQQYRGTQKSISEIGSELNVSYVLEGSGQKYADNFRLTTKLSDARNSTLIWSSPFDRKIEDILEFQSEVAQRIVSELKMELSSEALENLSERATFSEKAYSKYLEAQRSNTNKAIELLEEAIEIDPNFVDAYIQLGRVHQSRANVAKGELSSAEALELALPLNMKALEINPNHIGARVQLGFIKYMLEWDFKGAEREFIKASELSGRPINYISFLIQTKRFVEALELAARLRAYDPVTANYETMLSYLFLGEYHKALKLSVRGGWTARIYMAMHEYDKAIAEFDNSLALNRMPFFLSDVAICYYVTGEKVRANEILQELIIRYNQGEHGSIAFAIGRYYSGIEEMDAALEWLEKSYKDHEVEMIWLYADPAFETLQDNGQYIDLLKRVGFDV
jgi:TolB-like protein